MKATKEWGACSCKCGQNIVQGSEFVMIDGSMYLAGHQERRTRQIPIVKDDQPPGKTRKKRPSSPIADLPLFQGQEE